MEQPDITPTEHRNAALIAAFKGLDSILSSGGFELSSWSIGDPDEEGVPLNLGKFVSCRGEGSLEYSAVDFTWDELTDPNLLIGKVAKERWFANRAEAARLAYVADALRKAEEEKRAKRAAEEKRAKKVESDLAELRRLMAAYPAEVKYGMFANPPAATP